MYFYFSTIWMTQLWALVMEYTLTPHWSTVSRRPSYRPQADRGPSICVGFWLEASPKDLQASPFRRKTRAANPVIVATILWWTNWMPRRPSLFFRILKLIQSIWSNFSSNENLSYRLYFIQWHIGSNIIVKCYILKIIKLKVWYGLIHWHIFCSF